MSMSSGREYLRRMRGRYCAATSKQEKTALIDEVVCLLAYHRKYAIQVLRAAAPAEPTRRRRHRPRKYLEALPAIQLAWEALDYPCTERLHPVLLTTVRQLVTHGELAVTPQVWEQLQQISRATLARRLAQWSSPSRLGGCGDPQLLHAGHLPVVRDPAPMPDLAWAFGPQNPHRFAEPIYFLRIDDQPRGTTTTVVRLPVRVRLAPVVRRSAHAHDP